VDDSGLSTVRIAWDLRGGGKLAAVEAEDEEFVRLTDMVGS
jgi:hypothetical protein